MKWFKLFEVAFADCLLYCNISLLCTYCPADSRGYGRGSIGGDILLFYAQCYQTARCEGKLCVLNSDRLDCKILVMQQLRLLQCL